jgi:hypothetical protein
LAYFANEADYKKARAIFSDGGPMPKPYERWKAAADGTIELSARPGIKVERVDLDLQTFQKWCAAHGHDLTVEARQRFAATLIRARQAEEADRLKRLAASRIATRVRSG